MPTGGVQSKPPSRATGEWPRPSEHQIQELERILLVRKIAAPADIMDLDKIEYKIHKYCQLWKLYA